MIQLIHFVQKKRSAINDEGMPLHGRALMKGHLLWNSTSSSQNLALSRLTNAGHSSIRHEVDQCEETVMHDVNIGEMRRMKHQRRQEAYDKDEESRRMLVQGQGYGVHSTADLRNLVCENLALVLSLFQQNAGGMVLGLGMAAFEM
uniref:Uncharacterized protein n=1 Tax=Zea mays TaxID=4577 RepID=A0A804MCA0_MAIZE